MTPLTDDEHRAIVRAFTALQVAIQDNAADVQAKYERLRDVYRGESPGYVDAFPGVGDRPVWLRQLRMYLAEEIEGQFWLEASRG